MTTCNAAMHASVLMQAETELALLCNASYIKPCMVCVAVQLPTQCTTCNHLNAASYQLHLPFQHQGGCPKRNLACPAMACHLNQQWQPPMRTETVARPHRPTQKCTDRLRRLCSYNEIYTSYMNVPVRIQCKAEGWRVADSGQVPYSHHQHWYTN